ncbi:hypothetical protein [Arthrobacter sp. Br18]|uniref:hypothetical protein n=1 Tax=Arthrobacter sp. Br18 TaxID=1312954 RepID=UPI00047AD7C6|nr:hypothetical protein [Arthrobacter sp. Br18]
MSRKMRLLAVPTLTVAALAMSGAPATADGADGTYSSTLGQLNGTTGTGSITVRLTGNEATVSLDVSGLGETFVEGPYPHVQHIHGGAQGTCPTAAADQNGDGFVSTTDGSPFYGGILTTLTTSGPTGPEEALNLALAGQGGAYTIERTFEMNQETQDALKAGTAVVVVHGVDPMTATGDEGGFNSISDISPDLSVGATSPALCGPLVAQQVVAMPRGGADTGVAAASADNLGVVALGGVLVLAAVGGTSVVRRRNS